MTVNPECPENLPKIIFAFLPSTNGKPALVLHRRRRAGTIEFLRKLLGNKTLICKTGYRCSLFSKTCNDTLVRERVPNSLQNLEYLQSAGWYWLRLTTGDNPVDHAVLEGCCRFEDVITVYITGYPVDRLTCGVG